MDEGHDHAASRRLISLAEKFHNKQYRESYAASHTRGVLAQQMRNFRGDLSQSEYAARLGKQKTVIGRLENPGYAGWSMRTMLEIARKENVAVLMRFVDFPTFLGFTEDLSDDALKPHAYDQAEIDRFVAYQSGTISHHAISLPPDIAPSPEMGPSDYGDIFFGSIDITGCQPKVGSDLLSLYSGITVPTAGGIGSNFVYNFQGFQPHLEFWSNPPMPPSIVTPNALTRAHAEIERQDQIIQQQNAEIRRLTARLAGAAVRPQSMNEHVPDLQSQNVVRFPLRAA